MAQAAQGGQDLLVDAVGPADVGVVAEEAALIDQGGRVAGVEVGGALAQDVTGGLVAELVEEGFELGAVLIIEGFVGVEPEDPVAGGVAERLIARRGKAVNSGEVEDAGAQGGGDFLGAVIGAGIDHDHFGDEVGTGAQTGRQGRFAIFDDQAERNAQAHSLIRKVRFQRDNPGSQNRAALPQSIRAGQRIVAIAVHIAHRATIPSANKTRTPACTQQMSRTGEPNTLPKLSRRRPSPFRHTWTRPF